MRAVLVTVLAVAVAVALIWALQRRLIYFPIQQAALPRDIEVEEVTYQTEDGLTLSAWLVRASNPRGAVIVFNGNAGNRSHRVLLAEALRDLRFSVLLTDYRGYGGNPGSPSEEGLAADARAAVEYMISRDVVDEDRLVYFGESLGAAVATRVATETPPAALILRSPFSLADVAGVHYPFLPTSLLLRDRYPTDELIISVDSPLLVILGTGDRIVPPPLSRQVYEAAPEPKRLVEIEGAGHNDLELLAGEEMVAAMAEFLEETFP